VTDLAALRRRSDVNRLARMLVIALALLCVYTVGAGFAVARLLPARLALLNAPRVASSRLAAPAATPTAVGGTSGRATPAGVAAQLAGLIASGNLGPRVGALVTDMTTGKVLYALSATTGFAPASTTKLATAVAALATLGPDARFTTSVVRQGGHGDQIVIMGGGDPVLAAGRYPAADYPQPATLSGLAAATAAALKAKGVSAVRLGYDSTLMHGPPLGPGWHNYIASGNVAPIVGLEVDQGRLTAAGLPEDSDDPANFRRRSMSPGMEAAKAFARFLLRDGISVRGAPRPAIARRQDPRLAAVKSPPLAQIVQQMLTESNNVIAETLARQVAIATGRPGTFGGGASAVMAVDRRLGVIGLSLVDGSGLSPDDRITPRALVKLLSLAAAAGQARLRPVITGLPVAGFSGTLGPRSFFGPFGSAALGTVRAKTGNLTHVVTMAGIVYSRDGQLLAFAFMGNGISKKLGVLPELTLSQLVTALAACGCH
jgi:D-alanyl-D-alanine carboxypeptidase